MDARLLVGQSKGWGELLVHRAFEAQVDRTPDRVAVARGEERVTYRQLDERANQVARALLDAGVQPGSYVGLGLGRSVDLVAGMLGIHKAGAAYVPLDPEYPNDRIAHMVSDSGCQVLLTHSRYVEQMACEGVSQLVMDAPGSPVDSQSTERIHVEAVPDSPVYVIYTSGSTGKPKGSLVFHRGFGNLVNWYLARFDFDEGSTTLIVSSNSFDLTQKNFFAPLLVGGLLVLPQNQVFDAGEVRELIERHQVSTVNCTPTAFSAMVAECADSELARLRSLRWVFLGGEQIPVRRYQRWLSRSDCGATLVNTYGPTECSDVVSYFVLEDYRPFLEVPVPIGGPITNTTLFVMDPETAAPLPAGQEGELCIAGIGVGGGYLGRPELTEERFVRTELGGVTGTAYRTGDLARISDDGEIDFLGRLDHQVKVRGFRIELGEIEAVLEAHPAIREAVVVAREDASGEPRLAAYFTHAGETSVSELRAFLQNSLPDYMLPTAWVPLETIPLLPNGKTDRRSLPHPFGQRPDLAVPFNPPRTAPQNFVARIWREALGLDRVGVDDPFFELGGTSIRAIEFVGRMSRELGVSLPIVSFFEHPTVDSFLAMLAADHVEAFEGLFGEHATERRAAPAPARRRRSRRSGSGASDIAIVGLACRLPGSSDPATFWRNLAEGVESFRELTRDELIETGVDPALADDPNYVARAPVLDHVEDFDAAFFGYLPAEAVLIDPQQRIFLELCWWALEDAGYDPTRMQDRVGVYGGVGRNVYLAKNILANRETRASADLFPTVMGGEKDFPATRVAFKLDLHGPAVNVQTACSTSGVATHLAVGALRTGDCDVALVAGCRLMLPSRAGYLYSEGGVTSPDGRLRAFDAGANGMVRGSGGSAMVLKRLEDAQQDGDQIYAVIKGSAINNDGADKIGFTAPSISGQAEAIADALEDAGVDPESVSYVEAHGTGTELGDPVEVAGLTKAFGRTKRTGYCGLGSVKTNVGHLDAGACVTGIAKTALALKHRFLPPSLHFEKPNPRIELESSPFYVVSQGKAWAGDAPLRAGVSSFGLGGTNAHVVLEEAPVDVTTSPTSGPKLFLLSARSPDALDAMSKRLARHVAAAPDLNLDDAAYTLQVGRTRFAHRLAVVARHRQELIRLLAEPTGLVRASSPLGEPSLVFMFPGGGSQYVGMAAGLRDHSSVFAESLDHGIAAFRDRSGVDLLALLYPGQGEEAAAAAVLERPSVQLPALFILEVALAKMWMAWGIRPTALVGHSLGENTAAHVAGVMSFSDALGLVHLRGQLFEEVPAGGMLSVSASPEEVEKVVSGSALELDLAVVNAPESCVLSGTDEAIEEAGRKLDEAEVDFKRIPILIAAHSRLVEPILPRFREYLESVELSAPSIPMVSNRTGTWLTEAESTDPDYWVGHLRDTVQFASCIRTLKEQSHVYLEVGPARILGSLARLQDASLTTVSTLPHGKDEIPAVDWTTSALGSLWAAGVEPDWAAVHAGAYRQRVSLPTYPFERKRHWIEPDARGEREPGEVAATPGAAPTSAATDGRLAGTNGMPVPPPAGGAALAVVSRQIEIMRAQLRAMGAAASGNGNGRSVADVHHQRPLSDG